MFVRMARKTKQFKRLEIVAERNFVFHIAKFFLLVKEFLLKMIDNVLHNLAETLAIF